MPLEVSKGFEPGVLVENDSSDLSVEIGNTTTPLKLENLSMLDEKVASLVTKYDNTPGTAGGPGGRDRTLAVKSKKKLQKIGRFPEVGQKQKTEKRGKKNQKKLNDGNNNGQATHGVRKHAWRTYGARNPPGPR